MSTHAEQYSVFAPEFETMGQSSGNCLPACIGLWILGIPYRRPGVPLGSMTFVSAFDIIEALQAERSN